MIFLTKSALAISVSVSMIVVTSGCKGRSGESGKSGNPASSTGAQTDKESQELGPKLLRALMNNASLRAAKISVGTSKTTVTLHGTVKNVEQRRLAQEIVQRTAPGLKIVNALQTPSVKQPAQPGKR